MQIIPTGDPRFKQSDAGAVYVEIYEPALAGPNPPIVGIELRLLDRKTGEAKQSSGLVNVAGAIRTGNPVIPVGLKLAVATLPPGSYKAELKAMDSTGHNSVARTADFEVE